MKSLVSEVLSRAEAPLPAEKAEPGFRAVSTADQELEAILASLRTNIKVFGCGGGGSNTVNRAVELGVVGVDFYAANTDAQHLLTINCPNKILLGRRVTRGLGAGAQPAIGEEAAKEASEEIKNALSGADIVFITCGLGGGTGTGAAPLVAAMAKEMGALTIAVCTFPFKAEGRSRWENAVKGLHRLRAVADTVLVIPNDRLIDLVPRLSLENAFKVADEILVHSIRGLTEIITKPGLVNLDFNDLRTIMAGAGVAMIGIGESDADDRAMEAVNEALSSPLIQVDVSDAKGALVSVVGGPGMTINEAQTVAVEIQKRISDDARIIWGASIDPELTDRLRVMLVLTGVKMIDDFSMATGNLQTGDLDQVA